MIDTTRDAFEAWCNELHPMDAERTRRDYMPSNDGGFIWLAWETATQAATLAAKRQPLTDDTISDIAGIYNTGRAQGDYDFARAIEAAHGIKA